MINNVTCRLNEPLNLQLLDIFQPYPLIVLFLQPDPNSINNYRFRSHYISRLFTWNSLLNPLFPFYLYFIFSQYLNSLLYNAIQCELDILLIVVLSFFKFGSMDPNRMFLRKRLSSFVQHYFSFIVVFQFG